MKKYLPGFVSFLVGSLFGLGLTISGMTKPHKIIDFLDFFGDWDPTLLFVMIGAIGIHFIAYRLVKHKTSPLFDEKFLIPTNRDLDKNLILGSMLFGIGWSLAGYCPGPALASLITLNTNAILFVLSMSAGMYLHHHQPRNRS